MEVRRINNDKLYHHGIKGQKWGRRRYQNSDGSLTAAGRKRYGYKERMESKIESDYQNRKGRMNKSESAEITLRDEGRKTGLKTIGSFVAGSAGAGATGGQLINAKARAAAKTAALKSAAFEKAWDAQSAKWMAGKATMDSVSKTANAAAGKVAAVSAMKYLNPVTLAATGALAVTGTGMTAYNIYKKYKIAQLHDEYQIPNSKKARLT